jgi:hypothetical protein
MKNNTSQLLSELKSIVSSKPEVVVQHNSVAHSNTKKDVTIALNDIIDKIKFDAQEETSFEIAKKNAKLKYLSDQQSQKDFEEQKNIALQMQEFEEYRKNFVLSKSLNEDTPPTPVSINELEMVHLNLSTQIITIKELRRLSNRALFEKFKFHMLSLSFIFSIILFFETQDKHEPSQNKIIMPIQKKENIIEYETKDIQLNLWPNYVLQDNLNDISYVSPVLIFKNIYTNLIDNNLELNVNKVGLSGDKKIRKIIKKEVTKKGKITFDLNGD